MHVVVLPLPYNPTNIITYVFPRFNSNGFFSVSNKFVNSYTTACLMTFSKFAPVSFDKLYYIFIESVMGFIYLTLTSDYNKAIVILFKQSFNTSSFTIVDLLRPFNAFYIFFPNSNNTIF